MAAQPTVALNAGSARRMADPRAGIDVVGSDKARHFLVRVVGLVGEPARSHVPGNPMGIGRRRPPRAGWRCLVPGDAAEAVVAPAADHRHGEASQLAKLLFALVAERARHLPARASPSPAWCSGAATAGGHRRGERPSWSSRACRWCRASSRRSSHRAKCARHSRDCRGSPTGAGDVFVGIGVLLV